MNISMDFLFSGAKSTEATHGKKGAVSSSAGDSGVFLRIVGRELGSSEGGNDGYVMKDSLSDIDQNGRQKLGIVMEKTLALPNEKSESGERLDFRDALAVMRNMLRNEDGTQVSEEDIARLLANEGISLSDIALFVSEAETDKLSAEMAGSISGQDDVSVVESEREADVVATGESGENKLRLCVSSLFNALRRFVGAESKSNGVSSTDVGQVQEFAHVKGGQFSDDGSVKGAASGVATGNNTLDSGDGAVQRDPALQAERAYRDVAQTSDKAGLGVSAVSQNKIDSFDAVNTGAHLPKGTDELQTSQLPASGRSDAESESEERSAVSSNGPQADGVRDAGSDTKGLALELERAAGNVRPESASAGQSEVISRSAAGGEQGARESVAVSEPATRHGGSVENVKEEPIVETNLKSNKDNGAPETVNIFSPGRRYEPGKTTHDDVVRVQENRSDAMHNGGSRIAKTVDEPADSVATSRFNPEVNSTVDGSGLNQRVVRPSAGAPAGQEEVVLSNVEPVSGNAFSLPAGDDVQPGMDAAVARGQGAEFAGLADTGIRVQARAASDSPVLSESGGQQVSGEVLPGTAADMNLDTGGPGGDPDAGMRGFGRTERRSAGAAERGEKDLSAAALNRTSSTGSPAPVDRADGTSSVNVMDRVERFSELANRLDKYLLELVGGGDKSMIIRLVPANLGRIELKCSDDNGVLHVQAVVENSNVRDLLQQQESLLRDLIQDSGYKLAQFDVRTNDDGSGARQRQADGKNSDMLGRLTDESSRTDLQSVANASSKGHVPGRDKLWYVA